MFFIFIREGLCYYNAYIFYVSQHYLKNVSNAFDYSKHAMNIWLIS